MIKKLLRNFFNTNFSVYKHLSEEIQRPTFTN